MKKKKYVIGSTCCLIALSTATLFNMNSVSSKIVGNTSTNLTLPTYANVAIESQSATESQGDCKFLSDMNHITTNNWSYVGWGSIRKDLPPEGNNITLNVDGKKKMFVKGLGLHAKAQVTYDISQLSNKYTRFTAKAGVDGSRGNNGNIWFQVLVSNDGNNWEQLYKSGAVTGASEALDINVNVKGYKYLRIYIDPNGANTADHGVIADAKLATEDYVPIEFEDYDKIHPLAYYDEILSSKDAEYNYQNNYRLILEREFVNKLGYDNIMNITSLMQKYRDTIDWLLSTDENVEQVIEVGEISSGIKFINVLTDLYEEYKDELSKEDGPVYKKMMIAMAAAYTTDRISSALTFSHYTPTYDYMERFDVLKSMYDEKLFLYNEGFKTYHIELMRTIVQDAPRADEMRWLNYIGKAKKYSTGVYTYVPYISPNYNKPKLWAEENREKYEKKWHLEENGAPYGDAIQRYWMVMEEGGICWNQARTITGVFKNMGRPSIGCYQTGHESSLFYVAENADGTGQGFWNMAGNIFGWGQSCTIWYGGNRYRTLFNWANKSFTRQVANGSTVGNSAGYVYLAQANLNRYEEFKKSLYLNLLANSYEDKNTKVEMYDKAIDACEINLDCYDYKINLYKTMNKSSEEWYKLAEDIINVYTFYPMAMNDMLKVIRPYLNPVHLIDIDQKEYTALQRAYKATKTDIWQDIACREIARDILKETKRELATFSFDGDKYNQIIISSDYDGKDIAWHYSLDGGTTLSPELQEHSVKLTDAEVESITSENDIKIYIVGVSTKTPMYVIDIQESAGLPDITYASDYEDKLLGITPSVQWKWDETDSWKSYKDEVPDLTGDKTIIARMGPTGVHLAQKDSRTFTFTANEFPDTRKYISVDYISLHTFSTEADGQGRYAKYAIDANMNTSWHSNWGGNDNQKFISFKFDKPRNITALEYFPLAGGNGKIVSAQILVSMDGENWKEIISGTNWTYANNNDISTKVLDFDPVKAQYIKIVGKQTQNSFIAAKMFNFYEDITVRIVGTFSFDGENAKKIILDNDFKGQKWEYSLDGGTTWKNGNGDEYQLTDTEVNQITAENQIKMRFGDNSTVYTIMIKETATPTISAYLNDWENRLIGLNNKNGLEWQIEGTTTWTDYTTEEPIVEGNKKLFVRAKASGSSVSSEAVEFQFTEDTNTAKQKYIPIEHLAVEGYTSQSKDDTRPYYAPNAIDGNANTIWHSDFAQNLTGKKSYYTIKLDESKYISALEFMQKKYRDADPCFIKNVYVYISDNNQDWVEIGRLENIPQTDNEFRKIEFSESMLGQYVKIEMDTYDMFTSLSMINLYEDTTVKKAASFSFDGENAHKIILEDGFKVQNWEYSLDGGETWKGATGDTKTLTAEEVEQINGDNKIKVRINNVEYTINIQKLATPTISAYLNDLENRLIGIDNTDNLEWKIESNARSANGWTDYSAQEPVVEGDSKLLIRQKARNVFAASEAVEFNFTANNDTDTRKYIPISHLEIAGFSAEDKGQNGAAANAIDGNYNTRWLNSASGSDTEKYIVIKFDKNVYLSAMDYVPHAENGKILTGKILGSMDGENFTEITEVTWANNQDLKTVDFEESVQVRYVKIIGVETSYTSTKRHVGARMFNFYEDTTKKADEIIVPTAEVKYSTTEKTNQDVTVTLINESTDITVTNNNGSKTYTFTENGEFTFEFVDKQGNKGTATAKVDWIIKTLPNATFTYDINDPTNKDVTVTVSFDREGTRVTNNNGSTSYTFTENGEFTFEFVGPYGNSGTATAKVDWICKTLPNATFAYDINDSTNKDVTVTVSFDREGTRVTNNDGSTSYTFTENGEFTFEFVGPYGNTGVATAKVDWIDKTAPTATVTYDMAEATNGNVIATLGNASEEITITNNGGKNTYTFIENGEFIFEFVDKVGNKGTAKAVVNWIDRAIPNARISYNLTTSTNQPVIATISFDKENVTITNNAGKNTYTFIENGEFIFEFVDKAGNKGTAKAVVNWIDKTLPVATIKYSTTELTNKDVVATISFDKENVEVEGGNTHTFTENGEYEFKFTGPAGNMGVAKAIVNWIDKEIPQAMLSYDIQELTNKDVIAGIAFNKQDVTITNNDGKDKYTFTENGEFAFEFVDKAGNKGTAKAIVNWIDKIAPTATVTYDITEKTEGNVVATLGNASEEITITNNDAKNTYTFTKNGEFTFEFVDKAGNKGTAKAVVNWITNLEEEYAKTKAEAIKIIDAYELKATEEELNNKKVNQEEKAKVIEAYNKLRDEDKVEYTEFIDKIKAGGKPTITQASTATLKYKEGANIDLYSLITVKDNEDGNITPNKNNVKVTTNLDTEVAGTYEVTYEVSDSDGNKSIFKLQIVIEENTNPRFKAVLETSKDTLTAGEEFELFVKFTNIKNIESGLVALIGQLDYDVNLFEIVSFEGENGWEFDENSFNSNNFKFVTSNDKQILEDGMAFRIKMKVKDDIEVEDTITTAFKLLNLEASNGDYEVLSEDTQIELNVSKEEKKLKLGDVNFDGRIDITDLAKMKLHIIGIKELTGDALLVADVNEDNRVDITDLAKIKLHIIGIELLDE